MKYQIKIENKEDYRIFYNSYDFVGINYPHYPIYAAMNDDTVEHISFNPFSYLTTYTFQEWKLKFMKENKTYICPFDLAEGMVTKGTLYKRYLDSLFYTPNGEFSQYSLPQEIVEQWQEAPQFKVGDYVRPIRSPYLAKIIEVASLIKVRFINTTEETSYYSSELRLSTEEEITLARKYHLDSWNHCYIFHNEIVFNNTGFSLDYLLSCQKQLKDERIVSIALRTDTFSTKDLILTKNVIDEIITKMKQW